MKGLSHLVTLDVGLFLLSVIYSDKKALRGWRLSSSLLSLATITTATSYLVCGFSIGHYVNGAAFLAVISLTFLASIVLLLAVRLLIQNHLLYGPLLCLVPIGWWYAWNYYARPDGFWIQKNAPKAFDSLFVPADAENVRREEPHAHDVAVFQIKFQSELTSGQLLAYYTERVREAHFTLVEVRELTTQRERPSYVITYANGTGQSCTVNISEDTTLQKSEHRSRVLLGCWFSGASLNPDRFGN